MHEKLLSLGTVEQWAEEIFGNILYLRATSVKLLHWELPGNMSQFPVRDFN